MLFDESDDGVSSFEGATPLVALEFIDRFDFEKPVEPFSFDLEVPDGVNES